MVADFYSFLPDSAKQPCADMTAKHNVQIKVVRQRKTKHGDFRAFPDKPITITLNAMENPYRFLLTFLHEWAHFVVFFTYKRRQKPHGSIWQNTFREITSPFLTTDFFPETVLVSLRNHMQKPKATFSADSALMLALRKFDLPTNKKCIFELDQGAFFETEDGRIFLKGSKRRKRFLCICKQTQKQYLFPPFVEVNEV